MQGATEKNFLRATQEEGATQIFEKGVRLTVFESHLWVAPDLSRTH